MTTLLDDVARAIATAPDDEASFRERGEFSHFKPEARAALQTVARWLRGENHELVCEMIAAEDSKEANPRVTGNFHSPYFAMLRALASHLEKEMG